MYISWEQGFCLFCWLYPLASNPGIWPALNKYMLLNTCTLLTFGFIIFRSPNHTKCMYKLIPIAWYNFNIKHALKSNPWCNHNKNWLLNYVVTYGELITKTDIYPHHTGYAEEARLHTVVVLTLAPNSSHEFPRRLGRKHSWKAICTSQIIKYLHQLRGEH